MNVMSADELQRLVRLVADLKYDGFLAIELHEQGDGDQNCSSNAGHRS